MTVNNGNDTWLQNLDALCIDVNEIICVDLKGNIKRKY